MTMTNKISTARMATEQLAAEIKGRIEFLQEFKKITRSEFAADLISRIEISVMTPGIATPSPVIELKEIYRLIDETLNPK